MYVRRYLRHLRPAYTEPRAFQILVLQGNFYSRHMSWLTRRIVQRSGERQATRRRDAVTAVTESEGP